MKKGLNKLKNKEFYTEYMQVFLKQNSFLNLISKNDEKYLWEKHVFDSLAFEKFVNKYGMCQNLLDIGTGGGFPSVIIALTYPNINVVALGPRGKSRPQTHVAKSPRFCPSSHRYCHPLSPKSPRCRGESWTALLLTKWCQRNQGFDEW